MRLIEGVNWYGLYTLTMKEINRFLKVHVQTVGAPVVTALLYYLVFAVALHEQPSPVPGVGYLQFLAPGLIMMTVAQNAFANASSSLIIAKIQGNIVDVLMPPLSAGELVAGYTIGAVARGIVVGIAGMATMMLLADVPLEHPGYVLFHTVFGGMFMGLLGVIGGVWSDKFDQMALVQNFVVMPLTFLSGTFFAVRQLPDQWQFLCLFNPVFYMIDGFRYGFIGVADGSLTAGIVMLLAIDAVLLVVAYAMFLTGYKLRA